jgi:predicted transcriptional regulator YdeE
MCRLCEDAELGQGGVSITSRPAHRLAGLRWAGTFAEAASGAIHPRIEAVKRFSQSRTAIWKSPIVGLTSNLGANGFDYFIGVATDVGEIAPPGFDHLQLAGMNFATTFHRNDSGDVATQYARLRDWVMASRYQLADTDFSQREEYPHEVDLSQSPVLRLMLPVALRDPSE